MKDKTRAMVDELGHLWVKDALEHALKMKYALMAIKAYAEQTGDQNLADTCDRAIKNA